MITLKEGDKAPAFTGDSTEGRIRLADFKGRKLILYFYPEDDTPTCTDQACHFRDHYLLLQSSGYQLVGISPDSLDRHQRFITRYQLPFTLIADPQKKIIERYGVWTEKIMFGHHYMGVQRATFVIDEKGIIRKIFGRPKVRAQAQEIFKAMGDQF